MMPFMCMLENKRGLKTFNVDHVARKMVEVGFDCRLIDFKLHSVFITLFVYGTQEPQEYK